MRLFRLFLPVILSMLALRSAAADWPTYRHDNQRTGYTQEDLGGASVTEAWTYRSAQPPQPAWPGPARWDSYANIRGLGSMRNYDPCFHVSVAGDHAYFGSSTDDSVRCLDVASGKVKWTFTTDGPVRIAPSVAGSHVYFSSDDGRAYCVNAGSGELVWRSDLIDDSPLILNNGRFVSLSPCRTGVLVDGDRAWFAQGMLPWRNTVLHAVDRFTGETRQEGTFDVPHFGLTLEGALLANESHIIAPAGRVAPIIFRRDNGKHEGLLEGSGGSSVVLTADDHILCGPGNKTGWISEWEISTKKQVNTFGGPVATAVTPDSRVMVSRTRLMAWDTDGKSKQWDVPCSHHNEVIVAADTIYLGGNDAVAAYALDSGQLLWEQPVDGAAFGLAVTDGRLYVSTDVGTIHCFQSSEDPAEPQVAASDRQAGDTSSTDKAQSEERAKDRNGLLGHWVIHRKMSAVARRRGFNDGERRVSDRTGNAHALISGAIHIREVGGVEAIEMDGETNTLLVSDDIKQAPLPKDAISVETWVRVDESDSAGGIIGCVQDTKEEKSGWILGFHHQRFVFGLAAEEGSSGLSYLQGTSVIRPGHWYHVVARYDGDTTTLFVNGVQEAESDRQLGAINYPDNGFYEIGAKHDANSFHPMYGMLHEVRVYDRDVTDDEIKRRYATKQDQFNVPIELKTGPFAQFIAPDTARIRWETAAPMPTRLVVREGLHTRRFDTAQPTTSHEVIVDQLPRDRMLHYLIEKEEPGWDSQSLEFELDTHFNFSTPAATAATQPYPSDGRSDHSIAAAEILTQYGLDRGICLVLGIEDGRLAWELARQSHLRIIAVDSDAQRVATARSTLLNSGLYGARISVHQVDYRQLPFVSRFANLIVSESGINDGSLLADDRELLRVLRPQGGVVCLRQPADTERASGSSDIWQRLTDVGLSPDVVTANSGAWVTAVRPPLEGAGEWSHLYGRPDNSAFGGEELGGASTTSEMDIQWIGRPGPRAQPDRNGRKPSPLSTGGRLFVQGLHRIIALDGFNGTVIWALEIPSLERFNMPRDCSNWCADEEFVYIAARDQCWQIDATNGDVVAFHPTLPGERDDWSWDWGFIAQSGDQLIGSSEKAGTAFRSFWGDAGAGWYDARSGPATFKVCSDRLFSLQKSDGQPIWSYEDGVIINSTITIADDRLHFVETRHPDVKQAQARRVGSSKLWENQFLVTLDLQTGEKLWEQPLDTADGTVAFYLAAGEGQLVIDASTNKQFELTTFTAEDGAAGWTQTFDWYERKGDHGKAIQRPAIVGGHVYVRPKILKLSTGEILAMEMPDGKCGTYAATTQSLVFRTRKVSMWNTTSGSTTSWDRLRPGCWLSTIPASGMLLSPEGGGGCSCGSWMEMSVGFMPKATE